MKYTKAINVGTAFVAKNLSNLCITFNWGAMRVDVFWHNIRAIVFVVFPTMNLVAFIAWKRFMYVPKALRQNEEKRKRSNAIKLIITLIIANSMPVYFLLSLIYGSFS
ncbi:hypothetical protein SDC9_100414 [bioreactor metagenome]|uniref:Uncharacterized protein n=1 Tax=bioreactor metagenome TaxID=1076179 RepID=A0A645AKA4_9ZZZZ